MRALFVEDNEQVRELTCELLEDEGLDVVACGSAEAAQREFAEASFDVVLTDISLPTMSGTELARWFLERKPRLWLVFVSGYALPNDLSSFGPRVRSLLKPFEPDDLHALIEEIRLGVG